MDPDLYPDVNWQKEILKKSTWGTQANINISGGGKLARYYMSGFYRTNEAIYEQTGLEKYNTNVRRNQYSFRSNIDVNVTPSTSISLLLSAKLVDMNRPGIGTTKDIWTAQANLTPITVPIKYSNGQLPAYGSSQTSRSPSVLLNNTGFLTDRSNTIESLLVLQQNLDFLVKGLNLSASISFDNFNFHQTRRTKMPDLYYATDRNWNTGELMTTKTVVATPMNFSSSSYGIRTIYAESKLDYNQVIEERHRVGAMLLYNQKDYTRTDVTGEISSIPYRNQGIAGRLTYSYDDIYFIEGNFGYNGSENFPKGQRFGFFPSIALGYVISNYPFIKEKAPFINTLKLRYSYGLVGNDKISNNVRFPYLTYIDMSASGYGFGDVPSNFGGVTESQLGSTGLVWEKAIKQNLGIDLKLWDSLNLTVDGFIDHRNNIFMQRVTLPGTIGVSVKPWGNVGKMISWGADGTALEGTFTRPAKIAVDNTGNTIMVSDDFGKKVRFISIKDNKLTSLLSNLNQPWSCIFNHDYTSFYVLERNTTVRPLLFYGFYKTTNWLDPKTFYDQKDGQNNFLVGNKTCSGFTSGTHFIYLLTQDGARLFRIEQSSGMMELIGENMNLGNWAHITYNKKNGYIYACTEGGGQVFRFNPNHIPPGESKPHITFRDTEHIAGSGKGSAIEGNGIYARFGGLEDITSDHEGNIYLADYTNHIIGKIDEDYNCTVLAGVPGSKGYKDGKPKESLFNSPYGLACTPDGIIYVADTFNYVIRCISIQ